MVAKFSGLWSVLLRRKSFSASAYRGLIRCAIVKNTPKTMQRPPTTTYAIPRNEFLPPITVRVEIRMDFWPLYIVTGKSILVSKMVVARNQKTYNHIW